MNYVNEEGFFAWYERVTGCTGYNRPAVLDEVFRQYLSSRREEFVLPASRTITGREERYAYEYEDTGCCGASTRFIRF